MLVFVYLCVSLLKDHSQTKSLEKYAIFGRTLGHKDILMNEKMPFDLMNS